MKPAKTNREIIAPENWSELPMGDCLAMEIQHKLDEWCEHDDFDGDGFTVEKKYFGLCDWICGLPYSELITGENTLYDEKGTEASSSSPEN